MKTCDQHVKKQDLNHLVELRGPSPDSMLFVDSSSHAQLCAESAVGIPSPLILKLGTCRGDADYSELDL